jgi:hypothetical protein
MESKKEGKNFEEQPLDMLQGVTVKKTEEWFLAFLVRLANSGLEFQITLNVSGFLITGVLTSGKEYFKGITSDVFGFLEEDHPLPHQFQKFANTYDPESSEYVDDDRVSFLHLKNAKFIQVGGKPIPGNKGVWWRGRIDSVNGFCFGLLQAEDE